MKKLFCLFLTLIMAISCCGIIASADVAEGVISITSVTDGESYPAGSNITLSASHNLADVERIDFYANGVKIPGAVTEDSTQSVIWQSPAAGVYEVKAVASYISGATPTESVPVSVEVEPAGFTANIMTNDDYADWTWGNSTKEPGAIAEGFYSEDYAALGNKTIHQDFIRRKTLLNKVFSTSGYTHGYMLVYCDATFSADEYHNVRLSYYPSGANRTNDEYTLNPGWNLIGGAIPNNAQNKTIEKVEISRNENLSDSWTDAVQNKTKIYINGFFLTKSAVPALTATPVVPNGQTDVCNDLETYRIKFSNALGYGLKEADIISAVSIAPSGGEVIANTSVTKGTDYLDITIPESALQFNTTYEVTLKNTLYDCFGQSIGAEQKYTFTTVADNCTTVKPIAAMTFPKAGTKVGNDTRLTTDVIFSSNVSKVEFFEGDTLIGEAVQGNGREWQLDNANLSTGSHNIYAKITPVSGDTVSTAVVAFETAAAGSYKVLGIHDGDTIVANEHYTKQISVVDASATGITLTKATGLSKVVYKVDGAVVATVTSKESSYSADIPMNNAGWHNLTVEAYDELGGVTPFNYEYEVVYGVLKKELSEDFESYEIGETPDVSHTAISTTEAATNLAAFAVKNNNGSNALYIKGQDTKTTDPAKFIHIGLLPGTTYDMSSTVYKLFLDLDIFGSKYLTMTSIYMDSEYGTGTNATYYGLSVKEGSGKNAASYHLRYEIEYTPGEKTMTYVLYVDGFEYKREVVQANKAFDPSELFIKLYSKTSNKQEYYIDNISLRCYDKVDGETVTNKSDVREFTNVTGTVETEITVANTTAAPVNVTNWCAVYTSTGELISATPDRIRLNKGDISVKPYTIPAAAGNTVRIFTWYDGSLVPVSGK